MVGKEDVLSVMIQLGVAQPSPWAKPAPNHPEQRNEQSKSHFWVDLCFGATDILTQIVFLNYNKLHEVSVAQHLPFHIRYLSFWNPRFSLPRSMAVGVIHTITGWKAPRQVLLWGWEAVPGSDTGSSSPVEPEAQQRGSQKPHSDPFPRGLEPGLREGSFSYQVTGLSESHFQPCRLGAKKGISM